MNIELFAVIVAPFLIQVTESTGPPLDMHVRLAMLEVLL